MDEDSKVDPVEELKLPMSADDEVAKPEVLESNSDVVN